MSATTAMELVRPSRPLRVVSRIILVVLVVVAAVLAFAPWQQTAPGSGRVVAYAPDERRQTIEAPIEGRVLRWYVREGSKVKKGDPLVDLSDNDPDIMVRLRAERDAIAARVDAARARAQSIEARMDSLDSSRTSAITAAESRTKMAAQRAASAQQALALAMATLETAKINVERQRTLADKGLTSKRQLELTELDETKARTEVERAKVAVEAARSEEVAFSSDRLKVGNDATASIDDARATRSSAEAEVASASAELARIEVRLARQSTQAVVAPREGTIFRIIANGQSGEILKAGDPLMVLVPETTERAVEVWLTGNDMPLVREGASARIQFEGWPALQFSGWPSVATGTFGGRVAFVDSSDDGAGNFRALVVPEAPGAWPAGIYLRQGVRTHAWVQLGRVRLGYELWRQFNGFPPSLPKEPDAGGKSDRADKGDGKKGGGK
jgi:membrane fusion protein, adhesin transport system